MGRTLALLTLAIGLILMAVGLMTVAPVGETTGPAISNPKIPFAAGIWVLGIMTSLLTPVAYVMGREK